MNKRHNLSILVKNSYILTNESKNRILKELNSISEGEIFSLGRLLALEKKNSLEENDYVDNLLAQLPI